MTTTGEVIDCGNITREVETFNIPGITYEVDEEEGFIRLIITDNNNKTLEAVGEHTIRLKYYVPGRADVATVYDEVKLTITADPLA